jgi:K+:H+ antiporter
MHGFDLLLTLTLGLAIALVLGYLTERLGLSPIVGYLLAGIAVGPHTPGFVADQSIAEELAEVGVILLMFGVGLQFHFSELLAVRRIALPGAIVQSLVATVLGALVARSFGWDWSSGIIFGLAISVASTVVLMRVLVDNNDLHTPGGHIAVGWLVVEDLFTVVVLVLMPVLFGGDGEQGSMALALGAALVKVAALIGFMFLVGGRVIPWLLHRVSATRSRELFTLTVLVVALGIAVGSARLFGVSMALGAFLAGMVVGRSDFSLRAASDALPMRDAFAVLFFVSVGMLLEPRFLLLAPGLIAATLAIILIGKPLAALAIAVGIGYPLKTGLLVAAALAQIGEFSFILASMGRELGLLSDELTNTLVAAGIVSISINPLFYQATDPLFAWLARNARVRQWFERLGRTHTLDEPDVARDEATHVPYRAVVVGFGPVGRTLVRLLKENEVEPTVVELNFDAVQQARGQGVAGVYGDATRQEILAAAGAAESGTLVLSASNLSGSAEVIRLARQLNPKIRVLARSNYVTDIAPLKQAGADVVFSAEGEVALAMTAAMLGELGATGEQIDRERQRVRQELLEIRDGKTDQPPPPVAQQPSSHP